MKHISVIKKTAALLSAATILSACNAFLFATNLNVYAQDDEGEQTTEIITDDQNAQGNQTEDLNTVAATDTFYPENFSSNLTFSSLADYAINGNTYAFAQGTFVYIISYDGSSETQPLIDYDCGFEVKNLEFKNGTLYLGDADGVTYLLDGTKASTQISFTSSTQIKAGDNTYLLDSLGSLYLFNGNLAKIGDGYSQLKVCDNSAYAICNNTLVKLDGAVAQPLTFVYTDYSAASTILIGNTYQALKGDYTISTVNVESGAFCTEINLNTTQGTYFNVVKTTKLSGSKSALLLATSGNASIIVMNDGDEIKSYITLTSATSPTTYKDVELDMNGGYVVTEVGLYSTPYISNATLLTRLATASVVKITQKFSLSFIGIDFYKVTYTDADNQEISGYIPASYLTPYTFAAERGEEETVKGEFDYSTNVERVILVLIIVGLVIVAIAYLTIIGTRQKSKPRKSKSPNQPDSNSQSYSQSRSRSQSSRQSSNTYQSNPDYPD